MIRIAVVTGDDLPIPPPDDLPLVDALAALGIDADVVSWRADITWADFDAAVIRSTWDLLDHIPRFRGWLETVGRETRLVARPTIARWNLDKTYLLELERRGVPIVPAVALAVGDDAAERAGEAGWADWLAKPIVGGGAIGVVRGGRGDRHVATDPMLVQPFVREILDGEVSVVLVDGVVTHAVRKTPAGGDFRVQVEHGGVTRAEELTDSLRAAAQTAVDAVGPVPLLARVDLVQVEGVWMLMELELLEPEIFLPHAPEAVVRLAGALSAEALVRPGATTDALATALLAVRLRSDGIECEVAQTVARLIGDPAPDLAGLHEADRLGLVRRRGESARWSLTPAAEAEVAALLAAEAARVGRAELTTAYEAFLPLDRRFVAVLAAPPGPPRLEALARLVDDVQPVLDSLRERLARFDGYRGRLARALGRAAQEPAWIDDPALDSVPTVWAELREHLLTTLGRDRPSGS